MSASAARGRKGLPVLGTFFLRQQLSERHISPTQPAYQGHTTPYCSVSEPSCLVCLALCRLLQQRLGLLEVGGVKALGEPAVDRCQQLAGLGALALLLPQAARLMAARSSQDLACWRRAMARACWKQASACALRPGWPGAAAARPVADTPRPPSSRPPWCPPSPGPRPAGATLVHLAHLPIRLGEQSQQKRQADHCPRGPEAARPWRIWAMPCRALALRGQRPAPAECRHTPIAAQTPARSPGP